MVKCANCPNNAVYTYQITSTYKIDYCEYHLPRFLTSKKNAGQLPLVVPIETVAPVTPTKSSKKKSTTVVVEEPETVAEDATDS